MTEFPSGKGFEELVVDDVLLLRAVSEDEASELFALVDKNREYLAEYLPWADKTIQVEDSKQFIEKTQQERITGESYGFGIYLNGILEGHISLMHINDEEPPEIGYWVSKNASGNRVTTKATKVLVDFGFRVLGLDEILLKARIENIASNKIAENLDFLLDGSETDEEGRKLNIWRKKT